MRWIDRITIGLKNLLSLINLFIMIAFSLLFLILAISTLLQFWHLARQYELQELWHYLSYWLSRSSSLLHQQEEAPISQQIQLLTLSFAMLGLLLVLTAIWAFNHIKLASRQLAIKEASLIAKEIAQKEAIKIAHYEMNRLKSELTSYLIKERKQWEKERATRPDFLESYLSSDPLFDESPKKD